LAGSAPLRGPFLLAQEGTPFLSDVYSKDCQQGNHRRHKKHFHVYRIARSQRFALCNKFAGAKQL
jgi:hypothetical protein